MSEDEEDAPQNVNRWQLPRSLATLIESATETFWPGLSAQETKIVMREVEATIGEAAAPIKLGNDKLAWRSQDARAMLGTRGTLLRERLWMKRAFNVPENEHIMSRDEFLGQEIIDAAVDVWLRGNDRRNRLLEQELVTTELDSQGKVAEQEMEATRAMRNDKLNDGRNEEEEKEAPQSADGRRLPRSLATLLGSATEALWPELSVEERGRVAHEVEATMEEAAALLNLGNDKSTWRSPAAREMIGTRGASLQERLRLSWAANGMGTEHVWSRDDFLGQVIIDAAVEEWLRDDDVMGSLPEQECSTDKIEEVAAEARPQLVTEDKGNAVQLRRGRGCVGPLVRKGNFTLEEGTQIQGRVQTSHRPERAEEHPAEWNQHMLACQQGCELLPVLTPQRVREHLRTGEAMTISFYVLGQEKAVGVLFMSPLKLTRGAKLEGYNVDGIAVQEDYRGQGIGTFLMQVAKEEATLAAAEEGGDGNKTALSITVQEQLQRWLYPQGFTKNVEGRSVSWGANSQSFYWRLDDLCLDAIREWKWKARGMINPDCLCQLVSVVQVLLGNSIFTTHLRKATWPIWRAGDTLLRLIVRPHDPSIEDHHKKRFRNMPDPRHHSKELVIRLYYVLRGVGGEERKMSEQQDAQEMLSNLRAVLDAEQTEQRPVSLQGTQPSWTAQLWGVEMCATRRCVICQETRVMTTELEAEMRVMASTADQTLEYHVQKLTDTAEEMEANLCKCGQLTRWYRETAITPVGSLVWVHISRNHAHEAMRVSGRMRCPLTLQVRTSRGMEELRLTGVVIHTGEPTVVALPDGQHGETVAYGHYVANVHYRQGEQNRVAHMDDAATPYDAPHHDMYSSLDMIRTPGGGVESLALYQRSGTNPDGARQGDDTGHHLRLSLSGLGITALECQQRGPGGMLARDNKLHDLAEPKSWSLAGKTLDSMRSGWRHAMLNTAQGLAPDGLGEEELRRRLAAKERGLRQEPKGKAAIENVLRELEGVMRNRTLWPEGNVHLITAGHYREPLSNATPMVVWFGGIHSRTTGQTENKPEAGITLLFFSGESLRLAGLGMADASMEWTYERLMTQLGTPGRKNGIGVQCRITRLTADRPVVTWPGDWLAFAVGDLTTQDEGKCCSLVSTAWRPTAPQRMEVAKVALSNMWGERARCRLAQLGFPRPVRSTAATWLQKGTESWTEDELEAMAMMEERPKGIGKTQKDATPVKEPRKRAAP
jgi:GNAT superfamily N-acetyltransferase